MLSASNIHFEMAERDRAVNYGGIGAIHLMGQRLGLAEEIDGRGSCSNDIYPIMRAIMC